MARKASRTKWTVRTSYLVCKNWITSPNYYAWHRDGWLKRSVAAGHCKQFVVGWCMAHDRVGPWVARRMVRNWCLIMGLKFSISINELKFTSGQFDELVKAYNLDLNDFEE